MTIEGGGDGGPTADGGAVRRHGRILDRGQGASGQTVDGVRRAELSERCCDDDNA
jgi:hypothetical protein